MLPAYIQPEESSTEPGTEELCQVFMEQLSHQREFERRRSTQAMKLEVTKMSKELASYPLPWVPL
jgi:hypothetical protein